MSHGPMIRSRVNCPERVFLNSSDDPRISSRIGFNVFQSTFDTPILGAKKVMMLRASIPNAQISIPDYACTFWYYALTSATATPSASTLRCVRLYPSYWQPPATYTTYVKNRYFSDPADFVTTLNTAAAAGGDEALGNPYWVAGDVTFAYNSTTKQITMTGNTAGRYYTPAGWNDPNVIFALNLIQTPNYNNIANYTIQPYLYGYTMNLRVGYAMSGSALGTQGNVSSTANPLYANLTNTAYPNGTAIPADTFPNLVYSQCIYLYSNIVAGVSLGSGKQHNLLAVIPVNAPPLGVAQYTALTVNMFSKVVDTIYEIQIDMRDDANQPFILPDSAQVNLELAFGYQE